MTRYDLIAAVTAAPDDDTPRLALADYLEDEGDADWAELIRLQVGFFRDWTNYDEVNCRELELIAATRDRFPNPAGCELGPPARGFPMKLNAIPHENPEYAAAFVWPISWIRKPWLLLDFPDERLAVAEVLEYMPLREGFEDSDLLVYDYKDLNACDPARLRAFMMRNQGLSDSDAELIAGLATFANVEELDLSGNRLTDVAADRLVRSPNLRNIRYLNLAGNRIINPAALERRFGPALRLV